MKTEQDYMAEAVEAVATYLHINNADQQIRGRIASAISGGYDFADTLHNVYLDFGYPQSLTFSHYWNMYRRFGIARNVVDLVSNITWMELPHVTGTAAFDRDFTELTKKVKFWQRMKGLDKRQRVGRYAGMFMRVRDNKSPHEPIEGTLNGITALVQMVPLYEGQLKVLTTQDDPRADDYGLPTMYQFTSGDSGNRNEKVANAFNIHPSRVIIAAEGADDGGIYGISALEAPYNSLMDLRKIIGAGGEGFYKNAAQSVLFNLKDPEKATSATAAMLNKFNDQYDDFAHNRMRRALWTPGMDAKTLDSALTNPKEFFMNAVNDVASSIPCPVTILIGQQTGRLASEQDSRGFLSMMNTRRVDFGDESLRSVIDWLIRYGILPASDVETEWSDLLALGDSEKIDNAVKLAQVNAQQFNSGGETPFAAREIREAAGYEAEIEPDMEDDEPDTEDLPEDLD